MNERDERKAHEQELEDNDLLRFLTNFRAFWDKHGTTILLMILIVVAVGVGIPWLRGRAEAKREAAGLALVEAAAVQEGRSRAFANVAETHTDPPGVAAYALLRAGDAKLYEALGLRETASAPDATRPMLSERTIEQLNEAAEYYRRAIQAAPEGENALLALNAKLGLADIHVSKGAFDEARAIYQQVREGAGERYPALAAQAAARLDQLVEYNPSITFPSRPEDDVDAEVGRMESIERMIEQAERDQPDTPDANPADGAAGSSEEADASGESGSDAGANEQEPLGLADDAPVHPHPSHPALS